MTRVGPAILLALIALALPAHAAAKPALTIKTPAAGDLALAHVVIDTKGGTGAPKLPLANKSKLSKQLTIAGGIKKLKKNRFLASIVVLHKTGGASGKPPAFNLVLPKGVKLSKLSTQSARNLFVTTTPPKYCKAVPTSFTYVAKKLIAGSAVPRFTDASELLRAGYGIGCGDYDEYETKNLQAALRGEPQPSNTGTPGGGGGGSDEGGEDEDGEGGYQPPASSTLQGSGTVFDEGGGVFRYEISFTDAVRLFEISVGGTSVRCPYAGSALAAECGPYNTASAGSITLSCDNGEYSFQFYCAQRRSPGSPPPAPVPAGTTIVGRFTIQSGTVQPGKVTVIGEGPSGRGPSATLSGP